MKIKLRWLSLQLRWLSFKLKVYKALQALARLRPGYKEREAFNAYAAARWASRAPLPTQEEQQDYLRRIEERCAARKRGEL